MPETNISDSTPVKSLFALLLRVFWLLVGNMILGLCALAIVQGIMDSLSYVDVIYWVTAPLMVVARFLDVARYEGRTAVGEPATMSDWRRYAIALPTVALTIWLLAHGIAHFMK